MKPNASEAANFFWHCLTAAKLADDFPRNPATNAHFQNGVRLATVCIAGRNGVQYASEAARSIKEQSGVPWGKCGLMREHVVPVSTISGFVHEELKKPADSAQWEGLKARMESVGITPEVLDLFAAHPRAFQVAGVVLEWTTLAWITKSENIRFGDKAKHGGITLGKRMPKDWAPGHDRFARYYACEIALVAI